MKKLIIAFLLCVLSATSFAVCVYNKTDDNFYVSINYADWVLTHEYKVPKQGKYCSMDALDPKKKAIFEIKKYTFMGDYVYRAVRGYTNINFVINPQPEINDWYLDYYYD